MNCPKCGSFNVGESKFCVKCGCSLENLEEVANKENESLEVNAFNETSKSNEVIFGPSLNEVKMEQQNAVENVSVTDNDNSNMGSNDNFNFVKYIVSFVIKPYETYKNNESRLADTKVGLLLSLIVAGAMMIIKLLSSMVSVVVVKELNYSTFDYETTIDFSRLGDLNYLNLTVVNFLQFLVVICAIAVVYYLASLVVKKSVSFVKVLAISASSFIPYVVITMLISSILMNIFYKFAIIVFVVGILYSVIVFVVLINDNINFEKKDYVIYFHSVCIVTCIVLVGTLFTYLFENSLDSYARDFTNQVIGDYID